MSFLFNKNKAASVLIYLFSSSFRMGDDLPGPGRSPMGLRPTGRAVVPKERFCRDYNRLAGQ